MPNMPGIKNVILGLVVMAVSAAGLAILEMGGALWYAMGGVIVCGVMLLGAGLYELMTTKSVGADAAEIYTSDTIARLVMQSTIVTALADGPLDDEEIEMIATACESVVQERLDPESIRRLARLIEGRHDEILHEIHSEGQMLNPDARRAVVDACILVLKADDKVDVRQTAAVTAIARQLDFSEEETQSLISDAMSDAAKD